MIKLVNARVVYPDKIINEPIYINEGRIFAHPYGEETMVTEIIDLEGKYLSPGLIDIHTHGMGGYDFMDGTEQAILEIARYHLINGATTIIPTSLAGSKEDTERFLEVFKGVVDKAGDFACMPGVHMEGPYFAPSQKGAQPEEYLRTPQPEEYLPLLEKYGDIIMRWSAAPELEGTEEFAKAVREKGILLSYAHTDATFDQAKEAHSWGFNHYTHLYSCTSVVHRRNGRRYGGVVESAYLLPDTTVELICDGVHLPPELVHLAYNIKGADHIALVTDCMRATALGEGEFTLGSLDSNHKVIVKDGVAWMPDFTSFAGSVSTAMDILRTAIKKCGLGINEAVTMMTATPASIMGLEGSKGYIKAGHDADLIVFDEDIRLCRVFKGGKLIDLKKEV